MPYSNVPNRYTLTPAPPVGDFRGCPDPTSLCPIRSGHPSRNAGDWKIVEGAGRDVAADLSRPGQVMSVPDSVSAGRTGRIGRLPRERAGVLDHAGQGQPDP